MAVDFGIKKVGIALSDQEQHFAFPHTVVRREDALEAVCGAAKSHDVVAIVFGESKNFSGEDNPVQKSVASFAEKVGRKTGLPIYFEPEFYTTREAARIVGERDMIDAAAAAVILRSFIEKKRYEKTL